MVSEQKTRLTHLINSSSSTRVFFSSRKSIFTSDFNLVQYEHHLGKGKKRKKSEKSSREKKSRKKLKHFHQTHEKSVKNHFCKAQGGEGEGEEGRRNAKAMSKELLILKITCVALFPRPFVFHFFFSAPSTNFSVRSLINHMIKSVSVRLSAAIASCH